MKELNAVIRDLIAHKHEEEWFEFKANWSEHRTLGEYISALSNSAALHGRRQAYFVWGIENDTHKVVGTDFDFHQDIPKLKEPLQHYLARLVNPDIGFRFDEVRYEDRRLVVLTIPAAVKTPTAFDKERFLRIGSSKVNLMDYPEREAQLFYILRNGLPTLENTESRYQNLKFDILFMHYATRGLSLRKGTFKENLGLLTRDGKYNMLAQLLSDDSHLSVRFGVFSGESKTSTMYAIKECGNTCLINSLNSILEYGKLLNVPQADERNRVADGKRGAADRRRLWTRKLCYRGGECCCHYSV